MGRNGRRLAAGALATALAVTTGLAGRAEAADPDPAPVACVVGSGCYPTLPQALAAAGPGATVRLSGGTFRGGVTVERPVTLVGAGAGRTAVVGGGPVITVQPSAGQVRIVDLTVSGGTTHGDGVEAVGGGILAPAGPGETAGAGVTLVGVAVTGNRTVPTSTSPSPSGVKCPDGDCPYAGSFGGGIATWGDLTLLRSRVAGNLAGGPASDAMGGGIWSRGGAVVVRDSQVTRNGAVPREIGRFAEGAGVFVEGGSLVVDHSDVSWNRADLRTSWPVLGQGELIEMGAHAGGIHVGGADGALVTGSRIDHNLARVVDPVGEPLAFDAGLLSHMTPLVLRGTEISDNRVVAVVATSDDILPVGTAVEVNAGATITDTRITGNVVDVFSEDGSAVGSSGLAVYDFGGDAPLVTARRLVVSRNVVHARSVHGAAGVLGVGIFNNTRLDLRDSVVQGNTGTARGAQASAQGGGIWNGVFLSGPPVELTLTGSLVSRNSVWASDPASSQGGGIYNAASVLLDHSAVVRNRPDDCFGCASTTPAPRSAPARGATLRPMTTP